MKSAFIKTTAIVLLATVVTQTAYAACSANIPLTRPDTRYEAVAGTNNAEVKDKVTQLIWQRCVLGMTWNGTTCTGSATTRTWTQALDAARSATATLATPRTAWRLPSHAELYSLPDRACSNPAINTTWFPATPASRTWSSSPVTDDSSGAWVVYFGYGGAYDGNKSYADFVRLVRSGQ